MEDNEKGKDHLRELGEGEEVVGVAGYRGRRRWREFWGAMAMKGMGVCYSRRGGRAGYQTHQC